MTIIFMSSLLMKIHHIHECLKIICDVEADIFNPSLLGLFKKKNYAGNEHKLEVVCRKLADLHASVDEHRGFSNGVDCVISDAKDYVHALLLSTIKLIKINRGLAEKANGMLYSMTAYNQDIKEFRFLQDQYCTVGDRMNANYRLYSHEIALLG